VVRPRARVAAQKLAVVAAREAVVVVVGVGLAAVAVAALEARVAAARHCVHRRLLTLEVEGTRTRITADERAAAAALPARAFVAGIAAIARVAVVVAVVATFIRRRLGAAAP
jgi:hypothetical protein